LKQTKSVGLFFLICMTVCAGLSCDLNNGNGSDDSMLNAVSTGLLVEHAMARKEAEDIGSMSIAALAAESELPIISINTEDSAEITDKEIYVTATFAMTNADDDNVAERAIGIRLRGNTTIKYPKKPYRVKFDKKISLFGREANKSWVLLADYLDMSHVRNYSAFTLAAKLDGMDFAPLAVHVNLFLNGAFKGLYLLSDQVDEKEGRTNVEVDDLPEEEVPFLVELDGWARQEGTEGVDYFRIAHGKDGTYYTVKYPEPECRTNESQFAYIKNYITTVDSSLRAHGDYAEYVDMPSFIDFYLVQELMGQLDLNWSSVYMSRAAGGKLKMGPVWDFDRSAGGSILAFLYFSARSHTVWSSDGNWFEAVLDDPDFVDDLYNRWNGLSGIIDDHISEIAAYKDYIEEDAERDHLLWKRYWWSDNTLLTFDGQYQYVLDYLAMRKQWMTDTIAALYDAYY
jgi:hypothetical protein